ncbi:MAG TPA: Uma2 family endonuclease [Thermoanaerobaculia bacterium]|jgi:Uma2 family endonuclease|nr:Uma2 family endonuclease [Thermoanaerobaculia bacterium]
MSVALLEDTPLVAPSELGPYRREDYEALPDEPHCELIRGRFYLSPAPALLHQIVVLWLARYFADLAEASGGLAAVAPVDVPLAIHSIVQPDVIYVTAARRRIVGARLEGLPDLVIEVLSPGTKRRDRGEKLALYAESAIREYWIVDPEAKQIEFLVNEDGRFVVSVPSGSEYRSASIPEVRLDLVVFWHRVAAMLAGTSIPQIQAPAMSG